MHLKGCGDAPPKVVEGPDWAEYSIKFGFKMGKAADYAQWVVTGHRAASAWIMLSYDLRSDGWKLRVSCSKIPSLAIYMDGVQVHRHDMLSITRNEIDAFIAAGECVDASPDWSLTWTS
jgi:hypothetical protein